MFKTLLGNTSKDREAAEEMRRILDEMQQERGRCENLVRSVRAATERLQQLGEPIAKAGSDVDAVVARLGDLEERFAAVARLASQYQAVEERAGTLAEDQKRTEGQVSGTLAEVEKIRSSFEEMGHKIDLALALKEELGSFLEVDKPFQQIRADAEALRGHVTGTGDQLARLREQHDRLIDAHKLATSKMEALDRRRDDLGRDLQDKERRIAGVEQAVRGMDGVQHTVADVRRELGTLKASADLVAQKTAALDAQREAVERALAQADSLDRAMRQIDVGVRQQLDNEKSLAGLHEQVAALQTLHETVLERSGAITQLQREIDGRTEATRHDLTAVTEETKKAVERFDFERRGLESVTQRVADLRAALSDCESRFKGLSEPSLAVGEIRSQTETLAGQVQGLAEDVRQIDEELRKLPALRREVDETGQAAREVGAQLAHIAALRPTAEQALRDLEQLRGSHALVKDSLEQMQVAHEEIARARQSQAETRTWLAGVEGSVSELGARVGEVQQLAPTVEVVRRQAEQLDGSMAAIESRRQSLEDLHRRVADVAALAAGLDERGRQLQTRMDAAEERFVGLGTSAEEAERLRTTVAGVASTVSDAERKSDEVTRAVEAIAARCESVEELAEKTRALRPELDQRRHALGEAAKDLQKASALRQEAADSAQQLEELVERLDASLSTADKRAGQVGALSTALEDRAAVLRSVEKRMAQFEERLARWEPVESEIARSLEQILARQGTVESLKADLDRMFSTAEETAAGVREITAAHQEVEEGRTLLADVLGRLREVTDTASALDERTRQMTRAEERLARAEALLNDVRSSIEALQGQKALVDQAVDKVGSLQFLLKQAEAAIEGLRGEREMATRVRSAVAKGRKGRDEGDEPLAKAA